MSSLRGEGPLSVKESRDDEEVEGTLRVSRATRTSLRGHSQIIENESRDNEEMEGSF